MEDDRIVRYRKPGFSDGFETGINVSKVAGSHWNPAKLKNWGFWFPVISFGTTALTIGLFLGKVAIGAIAGGFGFQVNASTPTEMRVGNAVGVAFNQTAPVVFQSVGYASSQATKTVLVSNGWAGKNQVQFVNVRPISPMQQPPTLFRWEGQR